MHLTDKYWDKSQGIESGWKNEHINAFHSNQAITNTWITRKTIENDRLQLERTLAVLHAAGLYQDAFCANIDVLHATLMVWLKPIDVNSNITKLNKWVDDYKNRLGYLPLLNTDSATAQVEYDVIKINWFWAHANRKRRFIGQ